MHWQWVKIQQFVQHDFTVNISLNFAIILEGERTLSTLQILSVFQTQITGKHPSFPNESVEEEWICWMRSAPICIPGGRTWYFPLVDFNKCEKYASFWKAYQIWSIWMNLNSRKNHRSVISFSHRNAFLSRFNNDKKIRKFDILPFFNNTKKVGNTECAEKMCYLRLFCVWIDRFVSERGRARDVTVCNCNCNNVCATT